ncbi:glycosyltransferase [Streptomyces resistomycificus]|uniref:Glycosyl transferase n=1 Tax=Streptomyces resistomycificus TaxID=67356 RepID=A0A0L8LED2_9ACTN|nr:glycosyltransferase [Streptomyces resistomycificus]KOG36464.1 glycosyl transferase [Streptomyces resistomycificus]KUN92415.1 glycosyl transferase [Streptomyces resistomycificus]
MLKVSIVVPVYNAGDYIDRCAPSLLHQSLGRDAYEIVYVDDGSTDDSTQRLDRLAARHPHVRVFHQENSGWPGKPRNVGVRMARGEYVQFVDQDDELTPEALEHLHRLATRNASDIVLGKVIGTMQGPSSLFRRTVEQCTVEDTPLMDSLTPHKMFRRDFLLDEGITFPEGPVRLEDQLFMARAYVRAKRVSILGDHPCYVWNRRDDGGNTSSRASTPETYYGHLRTVVEEIKANTRPGPLQDHLLRRSYRVELLRPVSEPRVLQRTGSALERYFSVVRDMARDCYPPGVRDGLPAITRLRAHLLEEGLLESLVELASRTQKIRPHYTVDDVRRRDGSLVLTTTFAMLRPDGEPLTLVERYGRLLLDPELLDGIKGAEDWEVPHPLSHAHGELLVHDTARNLWWFPDTALTPSTQSLGRGRHRVVLTGETVIDPLTLAGGGAMPVGTHLVWANAQLLGSGRRTRLTGGADSPRPPALRVGTPPRLVIPGWGGPAGQLRLSVGRPGHATVPHRVLLATTAAPGVRRAARTVIRRLPADVRKQVRTLARRADPWAAAQRD